MKAKAFLIILIIGLFSWNYFYQLSTDKTLTHCIIDQIISQQNTDFAEIENLDIDYTDYCTLCSNKHTSTQVKNRFKKHSEQRDKAS